MTRFRHILILCHDSDIFPLFLIFAIQGFLYNFHK